MSALKTLPVSDEPRVLLIGAEPWLISQVSLLFAAHEITVTALSADDFLGIDSGKIETESVYKTIWWADFSQLELQKRILEKIVDISSISTIILGELPEEILLEGETPSAGVIDQHRFFKTLLSVLPESQFFFCQDFFSPETPSKLLRFSLRGNAEQALLDPEFPWFFCTREGFFEVVSPYFVRPHTAQRVIVRGKRAISTALLKKFADLLSRYYSVQYEIVPVLASRKQPETLGFVETAFPSSPEGLLDELARKRNHWKELLSALPSSGKKLPEDLRRNTGTAVSSSEEAPPTEFSPAVKPRDIKKGLINQKKTDITPRQEEKIEGELSRIFHSQRSEKKKKRIDDKVKIVKKISKKSQKNRILFYGGLVAMVLGGAALALWGLFFMTIVFFRQDMKSFLARLDSGETRQYEPGFWAEALQMQTALYREVLGESWLGEGGDLVKFETALLSLQQHQKNLTAVSSQYFLGIFGKGNTSPLFPEELTNGLTETYQAMGQVLDQAKLLQPENETEENSWLKSLSKQRQSLALLSQFPEVYSRVFGESKKQTYAVLLQNNLELRPTGGFIQTVAFLVFDKGLLVDSQVVSVYGLDEKLPGSVAAPAEIRKYLGEENWYLRDANWNPDFPLSAQRAAWFIRESTGLQIDGVWALNYTAIQKLLQATGPLDLPEYGEVLTAENLFERVEFHSGDELATGPSERKEYAAAVFTQLLRVIQETSPEKVPQILGALEKGLEDKQVLVTLFAAEDRDAMSKLEWNGEIINPICPQQFAQQDCLVDQIFQVESNIGLNRVNEYIKREVTHQVDLDGERAAHTRTVTLENTARSEGWPLGSYKAYLRFILDSEAQPTGVTIDGIKAAGESVSIYSEGGRRVVGVPVEIAPQQSSVIQLTYTTQEIPSGNFSFLLFDQKQSGIQDTPVTLTLHASGRKAVLVAPPAKVYGNSLEFSALQNEHLFSGASFQ